MAFNYGITKRTVMGNRNVVIGWFKNESGATGGTIETGLVNCESLDLQLYGAAVSVTAPVVSATITSASGLDTNPTKTIVTHANAAGTFVAIGI